MTILNYYDNSGITFDTVYFIDDSNGYANDADNNLNVNNKLQVVSDGSYTFNFNLKCYYPWADGSGSLGPSYHQVPQDGEDSIQFKGIGGSTDVGHFSFEDFVNHPTINKTILPWQG